MHSSDPAYARTGAFRDSGIPGIPQGIAPQCKIIPNALARIFRRRSTIIATGLLALATFAMSPVDNAEAQTGLLRISGDSRSDPADGVGPNYDYDNPDTADLSPTYGAVHIETSESKQFHILVTNSATGADPIVRLQFIGLGERATVTNTGATFQRNWTLTLQDRTASSGRLVSTGVNRAFGRTSGPDMFNGQDCECVIMEWTLNGSVPKDGRITFSLKPEYNATGAVVRPGLIRTGSLAPTSTTIAVPPRGRPIPRYRFRYITRPVVVSSMFKINNVEDRVLRERDPYSNPSGTNNDTPGDTATVIMDLNHFPTPEGGGDPTAATIHFRIGNALDLPEGALAAIGPGPDNGTNDFRVSPTNNSNPAGLIWSAIDSSGNGTVQVKRSLIRGTGNNSRPPNPGRLGVPGAANTLNRSDRAQVRFRFEPYNNGDRNVETISFNITRVQVSGQDDVISDNIVNPQQLMTIQPSGQANVKLAEVDSTGADPIPIHTDGESKEFTVELGGINPDDARDNLATNVRVNMLIAGSADRGLTKTSERTISTDDYSLTLPPQVNMPFVITPGTPDTPAQLSFTIPLTQLNAGVGTDMDEGDETLTFTITARVDDIRENTRKTISFALAPPIKAGLEDDDEMAIGDPIQETSDSDGTLLTYSTRRKNHIASLSGGGVDLHALGTNADTNSGTFTFRIEHYNHAISDSTPPPPPPERTGDYIYVRIDMVPTGSPVGLDTPPPTKFVNSSDFRMITSGDYTVSIPNNTSGVQIIPLTNEEAAFRLRIPLARFLADDTTHGTIATRGAEEVIMTVRANDVLPTRRQTTTFSINNVIEFDEGRMPSPFLRETAFQRATVNNPGNFGNDRVTFNLLLPEGLQSWITDGPEQNVTEGAQFDASSGPDIDRAFHVGTLYMTGGRVAGYVRATLTGTVPTGELTIGPNVEFNVQLSLLSPADGSRNNRRDNFSPHMLANNNRESGFNNTGSTATKKLCFGLSASGNITREFWAARTDGIFPQPDMDVTLAVTNIEPLQVTGGTLSASQLKSQCEGLPRVSVDAAPSIDARGTTEFTMLDNGDLGRYLRVDFDAIGANVVMPVMVEGDQFDRALSITVTPLLTQRDTLALPWVRYNLHARVESGGLTANNTGVNDGPPTATDPLADFTLLLAPGTTQSSLRATEIIPFTGFGNELVADVCHSTGSSEIYEDQVWILPRAANSIADGDKIITFSISDLFFPAGGTTRSIACNNDVKVTNSQDYPFLAGPTVAILDGPLIPEFTAGDRDGSDAKNISYSAPSSSVSNDFDTITLDLNYEKHIKSSVIQHPNANLAGVTHFVYRGASNELSVKRCSEGNDDTGAVVPDNAVIPIAELDCTKSENVGKGLIAKGTDRTNGGGSATSIQFQLRNQRDIGTQLVTTTVNSAVANLIFKDALASNPGIRTLNISGKIFDTFPEDGPYTATVTLGSGVASPAVTVTPTGHHSQVAIAGLSAEAPTGTGTSVTKGVTISTGVPFNIVITSEDRTATRTYEITPVTTSNTLGIRNATAAGIPIDFPTSPSTGNLDPNSSIGTVTLPATTGAEDTVTIAVLPTESEATVEISDILNGSLDYHTPSPEGGFYSHTIHGFTPGDSRFNISVSIGGAQRVYTITATVPSTDEQIDTLTVDGFDVSLDGGTSTGFVTIHDGIRTAAISASPAHDRAVITAIAGRNADNGPLTSSITDNTDPGPITTLVSGLTVGANELTITVSPEDTVTPDRVHRITVIVPPNGASLSALTVGGTTLVLNADDDFETDVRLTPNPRSVSVNAVAINDNDDDPDDSNCRIIDGVATSSCTTITIGRTDSAANEERVLDASVPVASNMIHTFNDPLPANGQIINVVVTNISAANVTSTRSYKINLIVPAGAGKDTSFRRITVADRIVSGGGVTVAGGLTQGIVHVTPTQRNAIVTAITGTNANGTDLTGDFTENTNVNRDSTTLSGFLLGRNQISVMIQSSDGTVTTTHDIRVTVPFSPDFDDSLASINGLTVNGAVVMLDHDNNTGTVDLPTGTEGATVIATPSQNVTDPADPHGATITAITGTNTNASDAALGSDQESNTARGQLTAELTGLTPDNTAPNTIVVMVSSPNGVRTRTYTIAVTIPAALSENTLLSTVTLTTSAGVENVDLDPAAGTGTAELPVGTTTATLNATPADDIRSTISDISGTNADGDVLTGTDLGPNANVGNRSATIDNLVTGEDNIIMITVRAQTGAMRTYAIRAEIDPTPTGVLTPASPLNIGNNSVGTSLINDGTFTLDLTGMPNTVSNGTDDVVLTAVDVFFAFTATDATGSDDEVDEDFNTITNNSTSVQTDDFTLSVPQNSGASFYPASTIGVTDEEGFVLRVSATLFANGAGSPTIHGAETITITVATKNNSAGLPYEINFANSRVAWQTARGPIADSNLAGPNITNFSTGATNVFNIVSTLLSTAELDGLTIAPVGASAVPLNHIFRFDRLLYTAGLPAGTTAVDITTDPAHGATVAITGCQGSVLCSDQNTPTPLTVNGNTVSGLALGNNRIEVVVTSEDTTADQLYAITATVAPFDRSTRINTATFTVGTRTATPVTLTESLDSGGIDNSGSGTVEIANTTTATIRVSPLTTGAIVTAITGCQGSDPDCPQGAIPLTGGPTNNTTPNAFTATLSRFTTGANQVTVVVQKSGDPSNTRTYTIAVTVLPPVSAAITTVGGASRSFREGSSRLAHVANFDVDVGAIHAGRCLSATINATSVSDITGSNTNGIGGDFVFYIVDQSALGGGSPPGDAVPQGFRGGTPKARTNGISIPLDSNGRGSRSFYIRARSENTTVDGDKLITFGISDPEVHLTGCSGDLNPGSPTALAVTGGFTITSVDDESPGVSGNVNAAAALTLTGTPTEDGRTAITADGGTSTFQVALTNIPATVTPTEPEGATAVTVAAIGLEISFLGSTQPIPNAANPDYSVSVSTANSGDLIGSAVNENADGGGLDGRVTFFFTPDILTSGGGTVEFTLTTKSTTSVGDDIRVNLEAVTLHNTATRSSLVPPTGDNSGTRLEFAISAINPGTVAAQEFAITSAAGPTSITTFGDVTIPEGTTGDVEITFNAPVPAGRSVEYTLSPKTTGRAANTAAASDTDYTPTRTVDLTPVSENTYRFPVVTTADRIIEHNEEATLTITNVIWTGSNFDPASDTNRAATLTITDSAVASDFVVSFVGDVAGLESGPITAVLQGTADTVTGVTLERDVTVRVSSTPVSPTTSPGDFAPIAMDVNFSATGTQNVIIMPVNDTVVEPNETLTLTVSTTDTAATASGTATVTINNDDELTNVRFFPAPADSVNEGEGDGTVTYTVQATGELMTRTVRIPFTVTPGTAQTPQDYTVQPASPLELNPGTNPSATITIAIADDDAVEIPETLTVALQDSGGDADLYALGTPNSHELTINSEDTSNINIIVGGGMEAGLSPGSFEIVLDNFPSGETADVRYTLASTNGSALTTNYTLSDGTGITDRTDSTITMDQRSGTLTVTPVDDADIYDELLTLSIREVRFSGGYTIPSSMTSTPLRITDDDPLTVEFASASSTIMEDDGTGVTLTLGGGTVIDDRGIPVVTVTPTAGTATADEDFTTGAIRVPITAADRALDSIGVTILDTSDTRVEDPQTINLALATTTAQKGERVSATGQTDATIMDDPPALTVSLPSSIAAVNENIGLLPITLTATAAGNFTLERAVKVQISTTDVTATEGNDFTITDPVVAIGPNTTTATANIMITDDMESEAAEETFTLILEQTSPTPDPAVATLGSHTTITITDNDGGFGTVTAGNVTEGGTTTVTVNLNGALPTGDVTFDYAITGTGADGVEPADIIIASANDVNPDSFVNERTGFTFTIVTESDNAIENDEMAMVTISNVTAGDLDIAGDMNGTFTIIDDVDTGDFTVSFVGASNGDEGNPGDTNSIPTMLQGVASADVTLERNIDVLVASGGAGDTATIADSDYTALDGTTGVVTFLASKHRTAASTSEETIEINPTGDAVVEPDETLTLTVSTSDTAATASGTATVTIVNDDALSNVRFAAPTSTFAEAGGPHGIIVVADGEIAIGHEVVVPFTVGIESGAATPGTDYTAITGDDLLVTFDSDNLSREISVGILDNSDEVEPDETVTLILTNDEDEAALYRLGAPTTHMLKIIDDSIIDVQFAQPNSSGVPEADIPHIITVEAVGTIAAGHSVDVFFSVDGTATLGVNGDYTAISPPSMVTFDADNLSREISVTIRNDDIVEPSETIEISLTDSAHSETDPRPYEVDTRRTHTITITDNDTLSVQFAAAQSNETEGNTTHNIAVSSTGTIAAGLMIDVDFEVDLTNSTATPTPNAGSDYTAITDFTVRLTANNPTAMIPIFIREDTVAEANETIILTLTDSGTDNDYALPGITKHTFTIVDDDALMVRFEAATQQNSMDAESDGMQTINIITEGTLPRDIVVPFTVAAGGINATNADYTALTSTPITLLAGTDPTATITFIITDDRIVEPDETIILTLMDSETGDGVLYNTVTENDEHIFTFTITDNDTITVQFDEDESDSEVTESRIGEITVRATGATIAEGYSVDVPFTFVSTATEDTDYNPPVPNSPITFGFNDLVKTISVTTLEDSSDDEPDETITFTLTGPGADYTLGTPTDHILTIKDASDDNTLASLTVDGQTTSLNHDNNTGFVTLLHAAIMHVPIVATATDEAAMIRSIAGQPITNPGQTATLMNVLVSNGRPFEVVVRAENDDTGDEERTYTITVVIPTTPQDTSQLRPMVSVSPTTPTIPETDGTVTIFVYLNRPVSETVELPFTITATDPAAADADDYGVGFPPNCIACDEATGGTLVFTKDQQQREITFAATPDTDAEGDQVILFKLNSGTQGVNLGAVIVPNTAESTITIRDDDIPPTSVSVSASRTRVREDAGTATITVTLNSTAVTGPDIVLPFTFPATASATFGTDYTVASDECDDPDACRATGESLVFATGDRTKTLTVTGIDDTPDDPEVEDPEEDETILFKLTPNTAGAGTVIVSAANEVTLTLAKDVTDTMETMRDVEVVTSLTGIKQVGMITGLIRQRFSDTVPAPSFGDIGSGTSGSGSTLNANALADDPDFGAPSFSMDLPDNPETLGDLLNGFGFNTYARADAGGVWSMWVRGQYTNMDGSTTQENPTEDINPTLSYDGSATGVGLGMEWAGESTIIGIAADYITTVLDISTTSENITLSKYKETILLAAPYFALRRAKSHSFWMSLGVGTGTANATLDGTTRSADVKAGFANAGIDITVGGDAHEFVAGLSGSAIRKETDPFTFEDAIIPKVTTDSFQARADITYAHTIGVGGGSMRPYIGLSTIHDFGDTPSDDEHALGLRSGITFSGLNLDLNLEGSSEFLRDDHKQWTISGNARFHSNPDNSGLSLSLDGSRGADVGAGIEGSYGLPIRRFHPDAMLTPFAALRREDDGNEVVSGMRFSIGDDLDIDLQNTRRSHDDNETAVNLRFRREF